jgi:hypothetical protein
MIQQPHNTVLFNIAAYTVMKLSVAEGKRIYSYIEEIMNGDGLYEGASKETILEAYYNQHSPSGVWTWVDLIAEVPPSGVRSWVDLIAELQTELESETISSGPWAVQS